MSTVDVVLQAEQADGSKAPLSAVEGRLRVADHGITPFRSGEVTAAQVGPGVVTFSFVAAQQFVQLVVQGGDGFCDPFGGVPSDGVGIPCFAGVPQVLPVEVSSLQLWLPDGATGYVWGFGP